MAKKQKANPYSLKGWNLKTWYEKNSTTLKGIILALTAIGTFFFNDLNATLSAALTGAVTLGAKLLLDTLDYFIKD